MNLPNKITLFRILLIPVFMIILLSNMVNARYIALGIFIFASATDFLDGYLARKHNLVTKLGKFLDPLADKLLVASAFIALVELGEISSYVTIIIIARELIISVFRAIAASEGIVIAASWWGKLKTNSQILAIVLVLLNNYPFSMINVPFDQIMVYVATFMTIMSGLDYILKNKKVLS